MEKTINQITESSGKLLDRRSKDIYNKTKENAELIYDLNDYRKKNKELQSQLANARMEIDKLNKQVSNFKIETTKKVDFD